MPEHGHGHAHHGPPDTSRGFEQSDLDIASIAKGVVFYFIFTGAIGVAVYLGFLFFHQNDIPPQTLSTVPAAPYPVLQNDITDRTDIWNLRSKEDFLLHNYTYVDQSKKVLREPINQAIDQLAAAAGSRGPSAFSQAAPGPEEGNPGTTPTGLPQPPAPGRYVAPNANAGAGIAPTQKVGQAPPLENEQKYPTGAGGPR